MLVSSIVRQTLGIKSHRVKLVEQTGEGLCVYLDIHRGRLLPCSVCGTLGRVRDRLAVRSWKHVPLWGVPVTLRYASARVSCPTCGKVKVEAIPWSEGKGRLSKGLIWLLSSFCKLLPWEQVAQLFRVHWNTVASAVRQAVDYGLEHRQLSGVLYIGIDELSLVGHPLQAQTHARLRLDNAAPRRGHPQLLRDENRQRRRRRHEQQSQSRQPPLLRFPHSRYLHHSPIPLPGKATRT